MSELITFKAILRALRPTSRTQQRLNNHGIASIEMTLIVPVVLALVGGGIDFSFYTLSEQYAHHSARSILRAATVTEDPQQYLTAVTNEWNAFAELFPRFEPAPPAFPSANVEHGLAVREIVISGEYHPLFLSMLGVSNMDVTVNSYIFWEGYQDPTYNPLTGSGSGSGGSGSGSAAASSSSEESGSTSSTGTNEPLMRASLTFTENTGNDSSILDAEDQFLQEIELAQEIQAGEENTESSSDPDRYEDDRPLLMAQYYFSTSQEEVTSTFSDAHVIEVGNDSTMAVFVKDEQITSGSYKQQESETTANGERSEETYCSPEPDKVNSCERLSL